MSVFLQNLNEALANKVYIERPMEEFGKCGKVIMWEGFARDLKQFVITSNYVGEGPGIPIESESQKEIGIEHIQKLVEFVQNFAKKIKFVPLYLPSGGVIQTSLHRERNIIARYLEAYIPMTDEIGKRWDFLIHKLD